MVVSKIKYPSTPSRWSTEKLTKNDCLVKRGEDHPIIRSVYITVFWRHWQRNVITSGRYIQDATGTVVKLYIRFVHAFFVTFMSNMNNYSFRFPSPRLLHTLGPFRACSSGGYWPTSVAVFLGVVSAILFYGFGTKLWPVNPTKRQDYLHCIHYIYSAFSKTYIHRINYKVYNDEKNKTIKLSL